MRINGEQVIGSFNHCKLCMFTPHTCAHKLMQYGLSKVSFWHKRALMRLIRTIL